MTSPLLESLIAEYNTLNVENNPNNPAYVPAQTSQAIRDRIQQLELLISQERLRLQAEIDAAEAEENARQAAAEAEKLTQPDIQDPVAPEPVPDDIMGDAIAAGGESGGGGADTSF